MIIAGLTGGIGHGKTTFANLSAEQSTSAVHFETWELVAEVAEALRNESDVHPSAQDMDAINQWLFVLPEIITRTLHIECAFSDIKLSEDRLQKHPEHYAKLFEYLDLIAANPELATVEITADNKETFRSLLQWLGGYIVARLGGVWYSEIVRRIQHLRSTNYMLVTVGGVRFPSDAESLRNAGGIIINITRPSLEVQDKNDLTERDRNKIEPDCTVLNDATLDKLTVCAQSVAHDLQLRQLKSSYIASEA